MKQITLGRSKENDVVIEDTTVSRQHATIVQTENGFFIYDNGSSNGTFINGVRIQSKAPLKPNDILKLGTVLVPWRNHFQFETKHEEAKTKIVTEQPHTSHQNVEHTAKTSNAGQYSAPARKKGNKGLVVGLSIFAFIAVVFVVLNVLKNSSSVDYNSGYANPVVLSTSYEFVEKGLMDKTLVGFVEVTNESNNGGNIEVFATCTQEGDYYEDSKTIYLNPGQTTIVDFEFRQIKRLKYEPDFSATALAIGE